VPVRAAERLTGDRLPLGGGNWSPIDSAPLDVPVLFSLRSNLMYALRIVGPMLAV
jgi:hypothetical protein